MLYFQVCIMKLWQKERHLSNPSSHIFCKFSHRVTLSRSFFIQTSIFCKKFSFFNTFLFLTCHHFFLHFSLNTQNIFLKKTNKTFIFLIFFYFLFKIKHHPTSRKKQNEELFFCIFSEIQNTFFCFDKSQVLWILIKS